MEIPSLNQLGQLNPLLHYDCAPSDRSHDRLAMEQKTNGSCRIISAKPTSLKKGKDIPKLPENYKKLYQYFRLFHFPSYNNIAVISHCFYK